MYDALTVTYAAVFRTSTPLDLDWTTEENSSVLGRDQGIITALQSLRREMSRLCMLISIANFFVSRTNICWC
jgi:hypothetical protein